MEEVLVVVFQLFFELLINVLGSGLLDLASRGTSSKTQEGCGIFLLHAMSGGGLGFVSTLIAPHLFLPLPWMRLLNLAVSPIIAGGVSYILAREVLKKDDGSGHFLHAFLFAMMFGLSRFAFAVR
ncbi:hypothetical protein [Limnoglobus roseus]|uniref:Uncharacterized protein n=1 Tax=Limnoglobus roseus TaxID=2598579 RepID=A0A5C1A615_9BACT|nr:hypothetical protein [Limnoglobus roseus]QEL13272.1 hypothetical protein PX52LOC_00126 [Limnoglobus roseus]